MTHSRLSSKPFTIAVHAAGPGSAIVARIGANTEGQAETIYGDLVADNPGQFVSVSDCGEPVQARTA